MADHHQSKTMQERPIFLIGMPASGKTYWGQEISRKYQLTFSDLDNYVSTHEQASIPALFAQYGERGFREREEVGLKSLIATTIRNTIIATGGGTPCYSNNMQLMLDTGVVIYLEADISYLLENLKKTEDNRPMLNGRKNLSEYLTGLMDARVSTYKKAHYILRTKDISLANFDEIIYSCTNKL